MAGEQGARVGMRGLAQHGIDRARLDRLAGIDDAEIVAQLGHDAEVVRDEQQRDAELAYQAAQQAQDLMLRRDGISVTPLHLAMGSSAMIRDGAQASAAVISRRWRWPPEN